MDYGNILAQTEDRFTDREQRTRINVTCLDQMARASQTDATVIGDRAPVISNQYQLFE